MEYNSPRFAFTPGYCISIYRTKQTAYLDSHCMNCPCILRFRVGSSPGKTAYEGDPHKLRISFRSWISLLFCLPSGFKEFDFFSFDVSVLKLHYLKKIYARGVLGYLSNRVLKSRQQRINELWGSIVLLVDLITWLSLIITCMGILLPLIPKQVTFVWAYECCLEYCGLSARRSRPRHNSCAIDSGRKMGDLERKTMIDNTES